LVQQARLDLLAQLVPAFFNLLGATYAANRVLGAADAGTLVKMNLGVANTLTVPADITYNFPVGTQIVVVQLGAGQTTFVAGSGVTVYLVKETSVSQRRNMQLHH
jgi:hypothetical protein